VQSERATQGNLGGASDKHLRGGAAKAGPSPRGGRP